VLYTRYFQGGIVRKTEEVIRFVKGGGPAYCGRHHGYVDDAYMAEYFDGNEWIELDIGTFHGSAWIRFYEVTFCDMEVEGRPGEHPDPPRGFSLRFFSVEKEELIESESPSYVRTYHEQEPFLFDEDTDTGYLTERLSRCRSVKWGRGEARRMYKWALKRRARELKKARK